MPIFTCAATSSMSSPTELRTDHRVQPGNTRDALGQPGLGQPPTGSIDHLNIVVPISARFEPVVR
jgi:hypothetical protein